jgi:hypothetical protein
MGKHNGKARKTGKSVGSALVNKARRDGKIGSADSYLYTTDTRRDTGIDSVIQQNDLEDLMSMVCFAFGDPGYVKGRLTPDVCRLHWLIGISLQIGDRLL